MGGLTDGRELTEENIDGLDEAEDTTGSQRAIKPWDPNKIRITTKTFSLREVVDQIKDADIDLAPDFQREYVWKPRQKTRLIESILLGIPLPAFYFNQKLDGSYQVVDGVQRLSTIKLFMDDNHVLTAIDLEYLSELAGMTYSNLEPGLFRRFRSAQIVAHVIEPQTPDEVKYDIFNRVNTLGSPLSAQEIRHAMSSDRSRRFLQSLAEDPDFDKATERTYWRRASDGAEVRNSLRMANRELALRFCAFRASDIDEYRAHPSLDTFLMHFTKRIDGVDGEAKISDSSLYELQSSFKSAMVSAHSILGGAAFRRWPIGADRRGPINRAVFESQANALADYSLSELMPHKEKIKESFRLAFDNAEYVRAVTVGTGSPSRVAYRMQYAREILAEAIKC